MVHTTCAVSDCKSSSRINKDLRFHQLPRTEERCKLWVEACKRPDLHERSFENLKNIYICSLHFENSMYGKKSLKKTAIPTLLLPTKDSIYTQTDHKVKILSDEDEPLSEKEIKVFCPKCKTEITHTAEGIQDDQTKILVAKVYHYFEQEYEELKTIYGDLDLTPLSKFRQRTALATGVSESTVLHILQEEEGRNAEKRQEPPEERSRARKRYRDTNSSSEDDSSDDNAGNNEQSSNPQDAEMLVVKVESPEYNNEEPEIYFPVSTVKVEVGEVEVNMEQAQNDPISLDVKTEPQADVVDERLARLRSASTDRSDAENETRPSSRAYDRSAVARRDRIVELATPGRLVRLRSVSTDRSDAESESRPSSRASDRSAVARSKLLFDLAARMPPSDPVVKSPPRLCGLPVFITPRGSIRPTGASIQIEKTPSGTMRRVQSEQEEPLFTNEPLAPIEPAGTKRKGRKILTKRDVTSTRTSETLALTEPAGTKQKGRIIPRKRDVTSARQHSQGESSTAAASSSVLLTEEPDKMTRRRMSEDERKERRRLCERMRKQRIKSDPVLREELLKKDRERYAIKKAAGLIIPRSQMTPRMRRTLQKKNRISAQAYYMSKKAKLSVERNEENLRNLVTQSNSNGNVKSPEPPPNFDEENSTLNQPHESSSIWIPCYDDSPSVLNPCPEVPRRSLRFGCPQSNRRTLRSNSRTLRIGAVVMHSSHCSSTSTPQQKPPGSPQPAQISSLIGDEEMKAEEIEEEEGIS